MATYDTAYSGSYNPGPPATFVTALESPPLTISATDADADTIFEPGEAIAVTINGVPVPVTVTYVGQGIDGWVGSIPNLLSSRLCSTFLLPITTPMLPQARLFLFQASAPLLPATRAAR